MGKKIQQEIIREWLSEKIRSGGHGTQAKLADFIGIERNVISKILKPAKGKSHQIIKADELIKIAEFFGEMPPGLSQEEIQAGRNELIALYERASPEQQQIILSLLKSLVPSKQKK